jgi:UDP-glucose 4-epimerase
MAERYMIVGGAGFIGSHFVDRLLEASDTERVTVFDNFTSGRPWHIRHHLDDARFTVIEGDVDNLDHLCLSMSGHDVVIHLASNPDIARAMQDPTVDFHQGTLLTHNVLEAMRRTGGGRILYASGSGIYGDLGTEEVSEDHGPLLPISTYGASKLAGESLICAYSALFDITACVFRFANVVGPRQTHGVGFDFIRRLRADSSRLEILGDGSQSKPYIHVDDVIDAVLIAHRRSEAAFEAFNVATGDHLTVREIAGLAIGCLGLEPGAVTLVFGGGDRGWKGDVPVVRLNSNRIRALGWSNRRTSAAAMLAALQSTIADEDRLYGKGAAS